MLPFEMCSTFKRSAFCGNAFCISKPSAFRSLHFLPSPFLHLHQPSYCTNGKPNLQVAAMENSWRPDVYQATITNKYCVGLFEQEEFTYKVPNHEVCYLHQTHR